MSMKINQNAIALQKCMRERDAFTHFSTQHLFFIFNLVQEKESLIIRSLFMILRFLHFDYKKAIRLLLCNILICVSDFFQVTYSTDQESTL